MTEFTNLLEDVWPALNDLVEDLPGKFILKPNKIFKGEKNLTELSFLFGDNMSLEEVDFYSYGCEDKIVVSNEDKKNLFKTFKNKSNMNNQVITGLVARIDDIDNDLLAREPIVWYEFVQKYFNLNLEIIEGDYDNSSLSNFGCFLQSLEQDTQLFQTMLNQLVSIPDVIANKFADYACMNQDELDEEDKKRDDAKAKFRKDLKNSLSLENFIDGDPLLEQLTEILADPDKTAREVLDEMTVCGLVALLMKVIECLAAQVSFDELLSSAVLAALKAMKVAQIGNMYGLLPASKQVEIYDIVQENLINKGVLDDTLIWPWEQKESQASPTQVSEESQQSQVKTRDTLAKQSGAAANEILQVLIETMLETVGAEDLLEYLNTFPGAEIIARVIDKADCISPPKWFGDQPPWRKTGDLPFCRANYAITLPSLPELVFKPPMLALKEALINAAKDTVKEFFRNLILTMITKLITQLKSEYCNILGAALGTNNLAFLDAIGASCGTDGSTDAASDATSSIFNELGSSTSPEEDVNLINNLSTTLTTTELCDLLQGNASDQTLQVAHGVIKYNNSSFLDLIPDTNGVRSFFKALGNYISPEEIERLCEVTQPLGDDFYAGAACGNSQIYDQIQAFRRSILEQNNLSDDEIQRRLCDINDNTLDNLEQIMDAMQGQGVEDIVAKQFPSLDSTGDPACPTVQGIFDKDDPGSSAAGAESIQDLLDGIEKKFKRDVYGRNSFFDWVMCATDGTRLRMQNFYLKRPLFTRADEVRNLMVIANTALGDTEGNNYYPYTIGNKLREDLISYAGNITFDSSLDQTSIEVSFSTDDEDYTVTVPYTHSTNAEPASDSYNIKRTENIELGLFQNEEQDETADLSGED